MKALLLPLSLVVVLAGAAPAADTTPEPPRKKLSKEEVEKAEKTVHAYLKEIKGDYGQVKHIADESVERTSPSSAASPATLSTPCCIASSPSAGFRRAS
jgi:hypothetical protein